MNLYKAPKNISFFKTLGGFIIGKFSKNIANLNIILPTFNDCLNLQRFLVSKQETAILPNIYPLNALSAENADIFQPKEENIEVLSSLEEKILLTDIICSYPSMSLKFDQALNFASSIGQLFYELELELSNTGHPEFILPRRLYDSGSPEILKQVQDDILPEKLLQYVYRNRQLKLAALKKLSRAQYYKKQLDTQINRLTENPKNSLIVAAILGDNTILWEFLKEVANAKNGFVILPQTPDIDDKELIQYDIPEKGPLYCLQQLLNILGRQLSDFKDLDKDDSNKWDSLLLCHHHFQPREILNQVHDDKTMKIQYHEYPDIFTEARNLGLICSQNTDKRIAIIITNESLKEVYINFLLRHNLEFNDIIGSTLGTSAIAQLIFSVGRILYNKFSLEKVFILLKNPLLYCEHATKLEQLLRRKNRFAKNWQEILELVKNNNNKELLSWLENISRNLAPAINTDFRTSLENTIKVAENLCQNLWYGNIAVYLSKALTRLLKLHELQTPDLNNRDYMVNFPDILKQLIENIRFFEPTNNSANILICRPQDAMLSKFDLVILPDFNENSWPTPISTSPWLNKKIPKNPQVHLESLKSQMYLYYFYSLLHNDLVIITRAKKQGSDAEKLPSNYIAKLELCGATLHPEIDLGTSGMPKNWQHDEFQTQEISNQVRNAVSLLNNPFPNELSATDIEILIRNPYSFYAKKILKLRKQDNIAALPKISEFGSFIHKTIEQYSKSYDKRLDNKFQHLINIGKDIIENTPLPDLTKKIWQVKFGALASKFIEFDEVRRTEGIVIYSEIQGSMTLKVDGQNIRVTTVADRVELDNYGNAVIIDYKTGTLPTKKDIESGLSPQLIIEALIALQGGFGLEIRNIDKILYVKISSSEPYISITEINFTKDELRKHEEKLIALLEYYAKNRRFSMDIDLLKYNDYKHLARIEGV